MKSEPQPFSFRLTDEMMARLEAEATKQGKSKTEIVRIALEQFFAEDHRRASMKVLLERFDRLEFENAKTRGVVRRALSKNGYEVTDEDVEAAGEDAKAYLNGG